MRYSQVRIIVTFKGLSGRVSFRKKVSTLVDLRTDGRSRNPQEYPARAPRKLHSRVGLPPTSFPLSPSSRHGSRSRDKENRKGLLEKWIKFKPTRILYPTIPSPSPLSSSLTPSLLSQSSRTLCRASLCHFILFIAGATDQPVETTAMALFLILR